MFDLGKLIPAIIIAILILGVGFMSGAPIIEPHIGNFIPYVTALITGVLICVRPWDEW